jgi:large subunit ribosomal protein L18
MYKSNSDRRKQRVRSALKKSGLGKLRLSVFRSNKHIFAQLIDDSKSITLASASTLEKDFDKKTKSSSLEAATKVGERIGERAKTVIGKKGVYFDRGEYLYHGKVKALAEGARKAGLKF